MLGKDFFFFFAYTGVRTGYLIVQAVRPKNYSFFFLFSLREWERGEGKGVHFVYFLLLILHLYFWI